MKLWQINQMLSNLSSIKTESYIKELVRFMGNLPAFNGVFDILNFNQARYCLEKMEIRIYKRGSVLFRSGDKPKFIYFILMGTVNCYRDSGLYEDVWEDIYNWEDEKLEEDTEDNILNLDYDFHATPKKIQ